MEEGKEYETFEKFERFSLFPDVEVNNALQKTHNDSKRVLLLKIVMEVPFCGVVDLTKIIENKKGSHIFVSRTIYFVSPNETVLYEVYPSEFIRVLNLILFIKSCNEDKMVKITKELNEILTEKKFYIDET